MLSERGVDIVFGLAIMTFLGASILVMVPVAFMFYLAGVCVGYGFHAGSAKHRKKSASTTKAEGN